MKKAIINQAFIKLSMSAKMNKHLDLIDSKKQSAIQKIEEEEIRAYEDDDRYSKLEKMKAKILKISFEEKEKEIIGISFGDK